MYLCSQSILYCNMEWNFGSWSFKDVYKLYKRFLKDSGAYSRAMQIYKQNFLVKYSIEENLMQVTPKDWISRNALFCTWGKTNEGRRFWFKRSLFWQLMLIEKKVLTSINDIKFINFSIKNYCEEFKCNAENEFGDRLKIFEAYDI